MFPVSSQAPRITAAPNIECDCTNTTVVVSGDPYSGITTMTSVSTFHLVNKRTFFTVGLELPDETLGPCNEPVTVSGKSYLIDTIDLATSLDLPGIGSDIELNWVYVGNFTVYNRGDGWESYCDGVVIDINPRTSIAPC